MTRWDAIVVGARCGGAPTAMGLAPCALGGGDSDAFAAATGLDYHDQAAVGEFVLGSSPG